MDTLFAIGMLFGLVQSAAPPPPKLATVIERRVTTVDEPKSAKPEPRSRPKTEPLLGF